MPRIYRPNVAAFVTVAVDSDDPTADDPVTFEVRVKSVAWTSNDHNKADEVELNVEWNDAGVIDPRILSSGTVEVHLGDSGEGGFWLPTRDNLIHLGRIVECERTASGESAAVSIHAQDYTSFFLAAKPVATASLPLITDTLADAWARLCDDPGVHASAMRDRIRFLGLDAPGPVIGSAVAARFRKIGGKIPVKPGLDAWAIWQQAVGMLGLISWIELDEVVVSTATDYYTGDRAPRLLWGENIDELRERRNANRDQKGVMIQSFDPLSGKTLEATYDPLAGNVTNGKKARKGRAGAQPAAAAAQKSDAPMPDVFQCSGITDQAKLEEMAQRVYEERARQALEGSLRTVEMAVPTAAGDEFDLLRLRSGDTIEVRFADTSTMSFARKFPNAIDRQTFLELGGMLPAQAKLIAGTIERMGNSPSLMYVKQVRVSMDASSSTYSSEIEFVNKIDPRGGTEAD